MFFYSWTYHKRAGRAVIVVPDALRLTPESLCETTGLGPSCASHRRALT